MSSVISPKPKDGHINYLDGWRGLAIILVLQQHFFPVAWFPNTGRLGVDIFFVLSGMLISKVLFDKRVPLKNFYIRRFSRVVPGFFIFVTSIYCFESVKDGDGFVSEYLSTILFLRSYIPVEPNIWSLSMPLGHLWSLNVEEHAYIIMSVFASIAVLRSKAAYLMIAIGMLSILVQALYWYSINVLGAEKVLYEVRTEVVISGIMLSSGYYLVRGRISRYVKSWYPLLTFFAAIICYTPLAPKGSQWIFAPFLLVFTVNHLDALSIYWKAFLSNKFLRQMGTWSFSVYLWQQPFYYYGIKFGEIFPSSGLVLLPAAILAGVCSFYFIENPARNWLNNRYG